MPFISNALATLGQQAKRGISPSLFSYRSADTKSAVLAPGYFDNGVTNNTGARALLSVSDIIMCDLADGFTNLRVTANVNGVITVSEVVPVSSRPGRQGLSLVAIGDSITAGGNALPGSALLVSAFSGNGTTGTITTSGITPLPGNPIWIIGIDQPEWNGRKIVASLAGTTITFTNPVPLTAAPTATAGALSAGTPWVLHDAQWNNRNFMALANGQMGLPFGNITNRAVSGWTTTQMRNVLQLHVTPLAPTDVWLLGGTNDILQSIAPATAFANLRAIVQTLTQQGVRVWWSTLPPVTGTGGTGTGGAGAVTLAMQQALLVLNDLIRLYVQQDATGLVRLVDSHQLTAAPTPGAGNYNWVAGGNVWTQDGIHPTTFAAYNGFARAFVNAAQDELARPSPLVAMANNSYAAFTSSRQLFPDPLMQATVTGARTGFTGAGGVGNPTYVTDFAPTQTVGTPTASIDVVARADGYGNDQRCVITATAASDQLSFAMLTTANISPQLAANVGRTVRMALSMSAINVPAGTLSGIDIYIRNSGFTEFMFVTGQATTNFISGAAAGAWTIESAPFVIPPSWGAAALSSHVIFRFAGNAAGATFQFGRVQLLLSD
jgi:hypothetical protein